MLVLPNGVHRLSTLVFRVMVFVFQPHVNMFRPYVRYRAKDRLQFPSRLDRTTLVPRPLFDVEVMRGRRSQRSAFKVMVKRLNEGFIFVPAVRRVRLSLSQRSVEVVTFIILLMSSVLGHREVSSVYPRRVNIRNGDYLATGPLAVLGKEHRRTPKTYLNIRFRLPKLQEDPICPTTFSTRSSDQDVVPDQLRRITALPSYCQRLTGVKGQVSQRIGLSYLRVTRRSSVMTRHHVTNTRASRARHLRSASSAVIARLRSDRSFNDVSR